MKIPTYVLITPAHNEQNYITYAIRSVLSQTIKPIKWIIVNDGSNDKTKEIVESYSKEHVFIKLINIIRNGERNFGNKAIAFNKGYNEILDIDYEYIGNLDADILLDPDYYKNIIYNIEKDSIIGIGGGIVYTKVGNKFCTVDKTLDSVAGAVQLFRRECFEAVGGYVPLKYGGIDAAVEIKAKMLGWKVSKFPEQKVMEQRETGSVGKSLLGAKVREGRRFYSLGYDSWFYLLRCIYRSKDRPFIIGSIIALYGYFESYFRCKPILLSPQVVTFLRTEQRKRIRDIPKKILRYVK